MPTIELPEGPIPYEDQGAGRPVVFLHGALVDGRLWRDVAPGVAEHARAIVPSLPLGAHTVPMRPDADLSPRGVARLVAGFLAALELEDVVLVGNDTGGAIAQMVVAHHPERVGALVLTSCDTQHTFPPAIFAHLGIAARLPGGVQMLAQTTRLKPLWRLPIVFGWLTKRPLPDGLLRAWLRPIQTSAEIRRDARKLIVGIDKRDLEVATKRFDGFDKPVRIVWAREDKLFPPKDAEMLARTFPNAELTWVDDAYTFVSLDQPAPVIAAVRGLLESAREGETATVR